MTYIHNPLLQQCHVYVLLMTTLVVPAQEEEGAAPYEGEEDGHS